MMAEEFDAATAAEELRTLVQSIGTEQAAALPPEQRLPLFREDHGGNLVTGAGALVRKKLEPLKLGGK